jgi:hypothetical protein
MNYKNLNLDYIYLNNNSSINYSYSQPISYNTKPYIENTIKNQKEEKKPNIVVNIPEIPVLPNTVYNKMFISNDFKNTNNFIIEFLKKNYENKIFDKLQKIKLRSLKEYEDLLKYIYEKSINMKKTTEKTMYSINKYLDFIIISNNGISSSYLSGYENKYKIDEIIIPDLIGFTSKESQLLKENIEFIFKLINNFLKLDSFKLSSSIDNLLELIPKKLIDDEKIFLEKDDYSKENINLIENINNFYYLLSSFLENGKFNLNKFLGITKSKNTIKVGGSNSNIFYKKLLEKKLLELEKNKKDKKDKKDKEDKKPDDIDKKVKYILNYESIVNDVNIKNYESLKENLRKKWWKEKFDSILKIDLETLKNNSNKILDFKNKNGITFDKTLLSHELKNGDINTIIKKLKKIDKSISKQDSIYLNGILENIFSDENSLILHIFNPESSNKFLNLIDFYTSKKINTSEIMKKDDYINFIQIIYSQYEKNYQNYEIQDLLPLKSNFQEKKDQQKISINILKGIGNYCNIIRKFLQDTEKRIYLNDVMIKERNQLNKLKREKNEKEKQQLLATQSLKSNYKKQKNKENEERNKKDIKNTKNKKDKEDKEDKEYKEYKKEDKKDTKNKEDKKDKKPKKDYKKEEKKNKKTKKSET